jgi:phage tail-like protein
MADDPTKRYPLPKFHFQVDWNGREKLGFTEVTGLDFETQVIEYRDGASPWPYNKLKQPGPTKYSDVVLKRGHFKGNYDAYKIWLGGAKFQTGNGDYGPLRGTVTISLLDENHSPIITWRLDNAWPSKIQSTDLKADGNDVAIETMTLVHEGLHIDID